MNKICIAAILMFITFTAYTSENKTLSNSPGTVARIEKFCHQTHWRNSTLIPLCMQQQIESIALLENYQLNNYPNIGDDHPVNRILMKAAQDSSVVVDGKPWADWVMVRYRFKRAMQDWLRAQGKSDPQLDHGL